MKLKFSDFFKFDEFITNIIINAYDRVDCQADNWIPDDMNVSTDAKDELKKLLDDWADKYDLQPTFIEQGEFDFEATDSDYIRTYVYEEDRETDW